MLLIIAGVGFALMLNWHTVDLGPRLAYVPLLLLSLFIAASGVANATSLNNGLATVLFGGILLGLYAVSRTIGRAIFTPFLIAVLIEATSCIVYGMWITPGQKLGGLVSTSNYAIAATFMLFGTVVCLHLKRWILPVVAIVLVGLLFTGAPEALFVVAVLGAVVLARRDWSRGLWIATGIVVMVGVLWAMTSHGGQLYSYTIWAAKSSVGADVSQYVFGSGSPLSGRWYLITEAVKDMTPFGHGYTLGMFTPDTVHNIPMIIVDQIGIGGAAAWTFATLYFLVKTKWKYAFTAVLALSAFDHAIWTQVAPWWWALCGVASTSSIENDLVFRKDRATGKAKMVR